MYVGFGAHCLVLRDWLYEHKEESISQWWRAHMLSLLSCKKYWPTLLGVKRSGLGAWSNILEIC